MLLILWWNLLPRHFHIFPQQSQDRTSVQLATGQDFKDTVPLALRLILLPEGEPPNKPDGSPGLRDVKRWKKWCSKNHWKVAERMLIFIHFYTFGHCCSRRFEYGWHVSNIKQLKCKFLLFASISQIQKKDQPFFSILFQLSNYPIFFYSRQATGTTYKLCDRIIPMQCWSLSSQISLPFVKAGRHGKPRGLKHGKLSGLRRHAVSPSICVEEYAQKKHISKYWYLKGRFDLIFDRQSLCILYYNILLYCAECACSFLDLFGIYSFRKLFRSIGDSSVTLEHNIHSCAAKKATKNKNNSHGINPSRQLYNSGHIIMYDL